ncbi:MAG: folate-binding protein YgfZ [Magnetococcales bacterium]|nr:folate-binding protein YgfZ [Magnetococcales bacterium]
MSQLQDHLPSHVQWADDQGHQTPDLFSSFAEEYTALQEGAALLDLSHNGLITVSGEERVSFLSGLITNEINRVSNTQTIHTAMLTAQGRFIWDYTILSLDDSLMVVTEPDRLEMLVNQFRFYLLRTKAEISLNTNYALLGVAGPKATEILTKLHPEMNLADAPLGQVFSHDKVRVWKDPRHETFGWRILLPVDQLTELWDKLSHVITPVGLQAWTHYRAVNGLPRGAVDLPPNGCLPLEAGYLELNSVDFKKGCFIGQETTARTHHRGTIKKRLFKITFTEGTAPDSGTDILVDEEKQAGTLTTVSCQKGQCVGMALLRVSDVASGKPLTAGGHPLTATKPDWAEWDVV